jgi:hypothetical protein
LSQRTIPCARHEEQGKRNTEAKWNTRMKRTIRLPSTWTVQKTMKTMDLYQGSLGILHCEEQFGLTLKTCFETRTQTKVMHKNTWNWSELPLLTRHVPPTRAPFCDKSDNLAAYFAYWNNSWAWNYSKTHK